MQRMTKQRQAVYEELQRVTDFRSAQRIHDDLQHGGVSIGLATGYRNLQALAEDHSVDVLRSTDGEALYRLCTTDTHHHHLVCRCCGRAEELATSEIERWLTEIGTSHGYTDLEHSIELFGLCNSCAQAGAHRDGTPHSPRAHSHMGHQHG